MRAFVGTIITLGARRRRQQADLLVEPDRLHFRARQLGEDTDRHGFGGHFFIPVVPAGYSPRRAVIPAARKPGRHHIIGISGTSILTPGY